MEEFKYTEALKELIKPKFEGREFKVEEEKSLFRSFESKHRGK
jgi:hypothetical protein